MDSKFQMLMKFKCQYGTRPMYNGNGNLQKEDDSNFIMLKYGGDSERNDRQFHQILEEMTEKVLMKSFSKIIRRMKYKNIQRNFQYLLK